MILMTKAYQSDELVSTMLIISKTLTFFCVHLNPNFFVNTL